MSAGLIVAVLAVAALVYIVRPLGRDRAAFVDSDETSAADARKRVALTGILDLEEERDSGKLSAPEFATLRARYEQDAIAALRESEAEAGEQNIGARLEDEIARARDMLRCSTCGAPRDADALRCPSCGSSY